MPFVGLITAIVRAAGTRHEKERPGARKLRLTDSRALESRALSSSRFMQRNLKYGRGGQSAVGSQGSDGVDSCC